MSDFDSNNYDPYNNSNNEKQNQESTNETVTDSYSTQNNYSANNSYAPSVEQNKTYTEPATNYQQTGSYTWSTANQQPNLSNYNTSSYQAQPISYAKPKKNRPLLKVFTVLFSCLIISAASISGFVYLINQGFVNISSDSDNNLAAFTINRIYRTEVDATNVSSNISQLTPQEIAEKAVPSVVCIQTFMKENSNQGNFGNYGGFNNYQADTLTPISQGSGIIYTADGYVLTNAHVVSGDYNLKVITDDGEIYEAELVGSDASTDLAVLKINAPGVTFTPAEFGSSEDLKVADTVMAIGNPGGIALNSTVTMGYVSALNREITSAEENAYALKYIQTDAAINPGNSGGALLNMYGQVVGINTAKIQETGYEGLGFAIPIDSAQPIISNLMQYGYVKDRAVIGISYQYIDEVTARFNGINGTGLFVKGLTTDNAINSGLAWGDLITSIDGNEITSTSTVTAVLAQKKPGDTITLGVTRLSSSETMNIDVVLSESSGQ